FPKDRFHRTPLQIFSDTFLKRLLVYVQSLCDGLDGVVDVRVRVCETHYERGHQHFSPNGLLQKEGAEGLGRSEMFVEGRINEIGFLAENSEVAPQMVLRDGVFDALT